MSRAARIKKILTEAFSPFRLEVHDDSARHAGHAGAQPGGETHYSIRLVADTFSGLSRLERHRLVHELLNPEFSSGLHALRLRLQTLKEAETE